MKKSKFYKNLTPSQVQCTLCNHYCALKNNQIGLCGVRKNVDGSLYSLVYEYPAHINIDPIEKKPLFHFQPGTHTYSIGTMGCNFKCGNCLNYNISQPGNKINKIEDSINQFSPEKIIAEALADECGSISYTYNEPTVFGDYALEIMKLAHQNDLKNIWVSNGFMSYEFLDDIIPYLDAINIDLKSFDPSFYRDECSAKINPVLENLRKIKQEQVHLELTTLIIPTLSDDLDMLREIADFIADELDVDTPWHLTKFSPDISWKMKTLPPTTDDVIYNAYEIGKDAGLKYVYVGNIPGDQRENTYCPKCNELAIRRFGYSIERFDLNGFCAYCDRNLDIIE